MGEPLKDVDPGYLPRTLDELRAGRAASLEADRETVTVAHQTPIAPTSEPSLEQTLDDLLNEAEAESPRDQPAPAPDNALIQTILATADNSPPTDQAATQPRDHPFGPEYGAALERVRNAERLRAERVAAVEAATAEENQARGEARRLRREHIARGNFARVFGTREDIQSDDYVSPITNMFTRVAQWGRRTEQQRQALANFEELNRQRQATEQETPAEQPPSRRRRNSLGRLTRGLSGLRAARAELSPTVTLRSVDDSMPRTRMIGNSFVPTAESLRRRNRAQLVIDAPSLEFDEALPAPTSPDPVSPDPGRTLASERLSRRLDTVGSYLGSILSNDIRTNPDQEDSRSRLYEIQERIDIMRSAPDENADINEQLHEVQNLLREVDRYQAELSRRILEGSPRFHAFNDRYINTFDRDLTSARMRFTSRVLAGQVAEKPSPIKGLDTNDERPEPKTDEDMSFKLECKVCLTQVADTACLPCGHLAMCSWCADQVVPVREEDRTRPVERDAKCPMCRVKVKQRVRIYAA